jgi:DNA-binding CsgD family transcriptional regulator/tetratricopeptide (TPR) repeat protein
MPPAEAAGDPEAADRLGRGRQAYARRAWRDAYESLSHADQAAPLGAEDLELLATSAGMLGRDDDYLSLLERAHHAHLDGGEPLRAVRCAFWVAVYSAIRGNTARATGWLGRAQRLLDREEGDSVERGYLLWPVMVEQEQAGDYEAAYATTVEGAGIGERFGDADLVALALFDQGRLLATHGRIEEGLGRLDEVMVAVSTGELSPIVTGLLYCGVIDACRQVYELRRAREWTAALSRWCAEQPEMVSFTGSCLVHRAEIMQVDGAWPEALEEARRARRRFEQVVNRPAMGEAHYRQGEIHRLRGERAAAEEAYREASRCGREPQPGLALLRLGQGDNDAAAAAIRRVVGEAADSLERAGLLAPHVEIMLAVGEREEARRACLELQEITEGYRGGALGAMVAHARGTVTLADGDAWAALVSLRQACEAWQELGVRYEAARARVLVGLACRELGDADAGEMELDAARRVFGELGAGPDLARVQELLRSGTPKAPGGLTAREVEVVRLVATGMTNRAIADELVISEKTVARHVSNVFTKLGVSSRSAVTAYAYEHDLV